MPAAAPRSKLRRSPASISSVICSRSGRLSSPGTRRAATIAPVTVTLANFSSICGWLNWTAVQDLGIHQARTDHARPNAVLLFLDAYRVSQPEQTALGSLVGRTRN